MSNVNLITNYFPSANYLIYLNDNFITSDAATEEKTIITILGSIGAFFNSLNIIHFLFRCNKNESAKASELIAYMNFSSLINTISYMLYFNTSQPTQNEPSGAICQAQGCLMVFSELSQFSTASIISIYISNNIFKFESNEISSSKRFLKILFGFIFPLILVLIGYFFNIFGLSGRWCWIKSELGNSVGFAFYVFIWVIMIFNISLIAYSYCRIKIASNLNVDDQDQIRYEMSYFKMMAIFPLLLIVCWVFPTINRIITLYGYERNVMIEILHITMILMLGVFISVASFLFLDWGRLCKSIRDCFLSLFSKCRKDKKINLRLSADNLLSYLDNSSCKDENVL